jgi:hypothetical protein
MYNISVSCGDADFLAPDLSDGCVRRLRKADPEGQLLSNA